jgi:zinc protease
MKSSKFKMENSKLKILNLIGAFFLLPFAFLISAAQTELPEPGASRSVQIPAVKETTLKNGLKVAVVERKNVPLVTVQLVIRAGAGMEDKEKAGLADMTASLLTKGTATRSATEIAEQMEFLGGVINTGASWNNSVVFVNVMADKLDQALAIMSDAALNPAFKQDEIDLLKSQTLDGLAYNLTQPGFLASYVASAYSFGKHPAGGTPESIKSLTRNDFVDFHKVNYVPGNAVLIFTGDITAAKANKLAKKYFGSWKASPVKKEKILVPKSELSQNDAVKSSLVKRILVVDLPNSGQAAVTFAKNMESNGRIVWNEKSNGGVTSKSFYPALVLNSLLGGGYSSRLNQEIRIKRGLSYGAGSSFSWQHYTSDFSTRTQTKNESAAEVAEIVVNEIKRLSAEDISETELNPRRLVLTGNFGRGIETTTGLANALAELYAFYLDTAVLNEYMRSIEAVKPENVKAFAEGNFNGGDIIIVGDYNVFKDDLAKRFPNVEVKVVKAAELDLKTLEAAK